MLSWTLADSITVLQFFSRKKEKRKKEKVYSCSFGEVLKASIFEHFLAKYFLQVKA